ncbi:MAG: nucleotidyl transferase AbiEii/AbiGii toxin family protein [Bacteroidetes bacterium]|nr:nucleotidyl transferase AbiEii/AbiGii toxin family protein [Bacteroidota bacterium]
MFSAEYLNALSAKTGFQASSLQKQMSLIILLREIRKHPLLSKAYVLRGGTAINLFWFELPRLSVDIDLNYIASPSIEVMQHERPVLEKELKKLIEAQAITVEHSAAEHAGGKWRLRAKSAFGGNFTVELDLNYLMRIPIWGVHLKQTYSLDPDYTIDFPSVSFEELFAGKIKALLDRSATRDLYDVYSLSHQLTKFDKNKLRKALILIGVTSDHDWRKIGFRTVEPIDQKMIDQELRPLLRSNDELNLEIMKEKVESFLSDLMKYNEAEQRFLNRFVDEGIYEPELLFDDSKQAERLKSHPAVLWKLQHHRKFYGLNKDQ